MVVPYPRPRFRAVWVFPAIIFLLPGAVAQEQASALEEVRARYPEAVADMMKSAEESLEAGPFSVMDKENVAPSGNKHDYFSLSPYHWPDPDTGDGLPYVFRDGEVNPEARGHGYDRDSFGEMRDAVRLLSTAFRYSGDERFAGRAALLIRVWFLDKGTRMSPNLEYAQWVMGAKDQPAWGIIRGMRIVDVDDAVDILRGSKAWTDSDDAAWRAWVSEYLTWLLESEKGKREARALNNHATWYDVQAASLALSCGRADMAREILGRVGERRIARQVAPDGRQPMEMLRTKSWDYSVMNLGGLFELAHLGEQAGLDLWDYETEDGRSIRTAFEYLLPYATGAQEWPKKQVADWKPEALYPLARRAAVKYGREEYLKAVESIPGVEEVAARDHLHHPFID